MDNTEFKTQLFNDWEDFTNKIQKLGNILQNTENLTENDFNMWDRQTKSILSDYGSILFNTKNYLIRELND